MDSGALGFGKRAVTMNPMASLYRLVTEAEWCCLLREELALAETFSERVGAIGRVAAHYAFRLAIFVVAALFLVFFTLWREGG